MSASSFPALPDAADQPEALLGGILEPLDRTRKPRTTGITIAIDTGVGLHAIEDLGAVAGAHCDHAKIAWGSALVTDNLQDKLDAYRRAGIEPLLGGTLFEYCYARGRVDRLLGFCREQRLHIEISDGVVDVPRADKLRWIEAFAANGPVFSEVGGKLAPAAGDWNQLVREELDAGAAKVVIEGREIGPRDREIRGDLVAALVEAFGVEVLVFEALERYQQVWLVRALGANVNLGNVRIADVLMVETLRRGLKEQTLLASLSAR